MLQVGASAVPGLVCLKRHWLLCISGRSKKTDTPNSGKWKLVSTHGDKELLVVKKKDRVSQEVFAHYRKSMDRQHQITMLDKDCDSPLPAGVVMYDCVEGAVIDDIQVLKRNSCIVCLPVILLSVCFGALPLQSITVVIDVNFVAAQKARLWALCVKLVRVQRTELARIVFVFLLNLV